MGRSFDSLGSVFESSMPKAGARRAARLLIVGVGFLSGSFVSGSFLSDVARAAGTSSAGSTAPGSTAPGSSTAGSSSAGVGNTKVDNEQGDSSEVGKPAKPADDAQPKPAPPGSPNQALKAPGAKPEGGPATPVPAPGELAPADRALLTDLLAQVGASGATLRSVERTPEGQVAVMLRLAQQDMTKAKAMYCSAGDRVLERFDAAASAEKNHAAMLETLVAVLPQAREAGCLNHIRNGDVVSVDVLVNDIPEAQRAAFVKGAEALVKSGKVARFLAPPREPDAFHFEFKRRTP